MAIQIQGNSNPIVVEVDGTTYRALRITSRPVEYGSHGQYRLSMASGIMAAGIGGAAEIFQLRWTATPQLALIWGVSLDGIAGSATVFTPGFGKIFLNTVRSWTVDGSGGTTADLTGNNQKLRTSMSSSLMSAIRISSTAALTAGTKVIDGANQGEFCFSIGALASITYTNQVGLYGSSALEDGGNPAPVVLVQNEGLVGRCIIPATGTWSFGITVAWSEVDSY